MVVINSDWSNFNHPQILKATSFYAVTTLKLDNALKVFLAWFLNAPFHYNLT